MKEIRIAGWLQKAAFFAAMLALSFTSQAAIDGDAANGKKIFKAQCAACHKLDKKLVGPALGDVTTRRSEEWLLKWIRNNAALRASGDKDANAIFAEYNGSVMAAFENLSDQDIKDILAYTVAGDAPAAPVAGAPAAAPVAAPEEDNRVFVLTVLTIFLALLIALLVKVRNTLRIVQGKEATSLLEDANAFTRMAVKNRNFILVVTIVVAIFLLKGLYEGLMSIGVKQDYAPEQPIAFSHKIHAGDNKVDCNYCHSSARNSKHSGIPSTNVCMNCHMYIDGSEIKDEAGNLKYNGERSPEIAKIYDAIGWDAENRAYIPNYEEKPVRWVRIHNLPDLAYFNHAQHVTAGEVACQTCHGPVEEMEVMYQYSPLTMGWCIECHRETEVKTATNGYYDGLHDELKAKYKGQKITVEKIGGLECGKCHY
jgi:mono/diheme cytochrome c family protein